MSASALSMPSPAVGATLPLLNTRHRALLPCHTSTRASDCFKRVTPQTMMRLLSDGGSLANDVERVEILDCRFPYEYDGGHIQGARNLCDEEEIDAYFATVSEKVSSNELDPKATVFIFHCEFSSKRGPRLAKHFRSIDRSSNAHEQWNFGSPSVVMKSSKNSDGVGETTAAKKRRQEQSMMHDTPGASVSAEFDARCSKSLFGQNKVSWTPVTRKLCDVFDTPSPMVLPQSSDSLCDDENRVSFGNFLGSSTRKADRDRERNTSKSGAATVRRVSETFSPLLRRCHTAPVFSPPRQNSPCPVSPDTLTHSPLSVFRLPAAASTQVFSSSSEKNEKTLSHEIEIKISEALPPPSHNPHEKNAITRLKSLSASHATPMSICSPLKAFSSPRGRPQSAASQNGMKVPGRVSRPLTPCSKSAPLPDTKSPKHDVPLTSHVLNFPCSPQNSKSIPPIYSKGLLDDVPQDSRMCDSPNASLNLFPSPLFVRNSSKKRKRSERKATRHLAHARELELGGKSDSLKGATHPADLGVPLDMISRTEALSISNENTLSVPDLAPCFGVNASLAITSPSPAVPQKKLKRGTPPCFALTSPSMEGPDPGITFPQVYILEGGYKAFYNEAVQISQVPRYCEPPAYVPMDAKDLPRLSRRSRSLGSELAAAQARHGPRRAVKRRVRVNSRCLFAGADFGVSS